MLRIQHPITPTFHYSITPPFVSGPTDSVPKDSALVTKPGMPPPRQITLWTRNDGSASTRRSSKRSVYFWYRQSPRHLAAGPESDHRELSDACYLRASRRFSWSLSFFTNAAFAVATFFVSFAFDE